MQKVSSITIPENLLNHLTQLSPRNRALTLRATTVAFLKSPNCNSQFLASIPVQDKCVRIGLKSSAPENKAFLRSVRKVAKVVSSRGSVSEVISAAVYWHKTEVAA